MSRAMRWLHVLLGGDHHQLSEKLFFINKIPRMDNRNIGNIRKIIWI